MFDPILTILHPAQLKTTWLFLVLESEYNIFKYLLHCWDRKAPWCRLYAATSDSLCLSRSITHIQTTMLKFQVSNNMRRYLLFWKRPHWLNNEPNQWIPIFDTFIFMSKFYIVVASHTFNKSWTDLEPEQISFVFFYIRDWASKQQTPSQLKRRRRNAHNWRNEEKY